MEAGAGAVKSLICIFSSLCGLHLKTGHCDTSETVLLYGPHGKYISNPHVFKFHNVIQYISPDQQNQFWAFFSLTKTSRLFG